MILCNALVCSHVQQRPADDSIGEQPAAGVLLLDTGQPSGLRVSRKRGQGQPAKLLHVCQDGGGSVQRE